MPIYEYKCRDCDLRFEEFVQGVTGSSEVKCPRCGSIHTAKAWSVFGMGYTGSDAKGSRMLDADSCSRSEAGT